MSGAAGAGEGMRGESEIDKEIKGHPPDLLTQTRALGQRPHKCLIPPDLLGIAEMERGGRVS